MSKKIYLSPSNQTGNKYCIGSTNEGTVQNDIAKLLVKLLEEYDCEVKMADMKMNLTNRAAEAKTWGASVYLAMHSNALNGTVRGVRVYYGNKQANYAARKEFAQCVLDQMATVFKNGGLFIDNTLIDCRLPVMPSIIAEVGFHDNREDATFILNNKPAIAGLYCKALVKYLGLEKKVKEKTKSETKTSTVGTGDKVILKNVKLYVSSTATQHSSIISGTYYIWNNVPNKGRIRITTSQSSINMAGKVTGWINLDDISSEVVYTVAKGDTLAKIAIKYSTSVAKLVARNGIRNPDLIRIGQQIIIPQNVTYIVEKGDTLAKIASRFSTTVAKIVKANDISNPDLIRIGQKIIIP